MNQFFKQPIGFALLFIPAALIGRFLLPGLFLIVYSLLYCLFLKVHLSKQFREYAALYLMIGKLILGLISLAILFGIAALFSIKGISDLFFSIPNEITQSLVHSELAHAMPAVVIWLVAVPLIIGGIITMLGITFFLNYFAITFGNWIARYFMKNKKVEEI
jgi:hypothetical protein